MAATPYFCATMGSLITTFLPSRMISPPSGWCTPVSVLIYGLSCGIRIADHPGKKKYSYRFNVIKDYVGDKVIIKDGLICRFYDFTELEEVIKAVQKERQEKINKYGLQNYKKYMERESKDDLYTRFKKMEVKKK